ncbi:Nascent polypeptide-associated complex subunit beta [Tulasnella sp. 427]|nr:Nascent polypeptide-associated complex subunit beta [Tulasnella sp. 427]
MPLDTAKLAKLKAQNVSRLGGWTDRRSFALRIISPVDQGAQEERAVVGPDLAAGVAAYERDVLIDHYSLACTPSPNYQLKIQQPKYYRYHLEPTACNGPTRGGRTGGKGTPRRKVIKKTGVSGGGSDQKLQGALKKLNLQPITAVEEVNMFQDDGNVLHFQTPKVHAALTSNTIAVYGVGQVKELTDLVPGILGQLGPDSLASLRKLAAQYQSQTAAAAAAAAAAAEANGGAAKGEGEDDDDVPDLVESFEPTDEAKAEDGAGEEKDEKAEEKAEEKEDEKAEEKKDEKKDEEKKDIDELN